MTFTLSLLRPELPVCNMLHIWAFLSMIMCGGGRLWATQQGSCMRRQDAPHRGVSDTSFWQDTFEGNGP